jgi:hypothetical protein
MAISGQEAASGKLGKPVKRSADKYASNARLPTPVESRLSLV